jgi:hypothetical protein
MQCIMLYIMYDMFCVCRLCSVLPFYAIHLTKRRLINFESRVIFTWREFSLKDWRAEIHMSFTYVSTSRRRHFDVGCETARNKMV